MQVTSFSVEDDIKKRVVFFQGWGKGKGGYFGWSRGGGMQNKPKIALGSTPRRLY